MPIKDTLNLLKSLVLGSNRSVTVTEGCSGIPNPDALVNGLAKVPMNAQAKCFAVILIQCF